MLFEMALFKTHLLLLGSLVKAWRPYFFSRQRFGLKMEVEGFYPGAKEKLLRFVLINFKFMVFFNSLYSVS